jgi:hypothetical protein
MVSVRNISKHCNDSVIEALDFNHIKARRLFNLETRVTRRVPLVKLELVTLLEHLTSPRICSGVRVARSLVFCVVFCRSLFFVVLL